MEIKKVAVIGAGTMGASIAVALAGSGYSVLLKDISADFVDAGFARIKRFFDSKVKKGLAQAEADQQRSLIRGTTSYDDFADIDLVVEAVLEKIEVKQAVFEELDRICKADAILASNTSGLSITRIGSFTKRPERVVGLHFFNPAHIMKLVEVIAGLETSDETIQRALQFAASLGKFPVRVEECASFLVNRLLGRYMNESLYCLQEGAGSVEEIDKAVCDYVAPIGPFALRDMNGADIGLAVATVNYQEYGERFRPAPILQDMVNANMLGQKTGKGFYLYDKETKKRLSPNDDLQPLLKGYRHETHEDLSVERLFLPMINEAFVALQERVCTAEDLDPAIMAGLGLRKGPLALAAEMGLSNCLEMMEEHFVRHGERFRPAPLLKRYVWASKKIVV